MKRGRIRWRHDSLKQFRNEQEFSVKGLENAVLKEGRKEIFILASM